MKKARQNWMGDQKDADANLYYAAVEGELPIEGMGDNLIIFNVAHLQDFALPLPGVSQSISTPMEMALPHYLQEFIILEISLQQIFILKTTMPLEQILTGLHLQDILTVAMEQNNLLQLTVFQVQLQPEKYKKIQILTKKMAMLCMQADAMILPRL